MITYIDTKNREKYQVLFAKAEETLKNADASKLSAGIDPSKVEIATLNQYFAYLKDLITVSSNENIKSYFLRLPLDEELFAINANTRTISIPRSFSSNGVGVQGDETAEIVYFSIDRYFDHMDLANEDMNIVIQWETRDKNREIITGISPNFGKDIETIPGKIIFGWPIYSELTDSATPIRFAVRFFSLGEADDEGVRSLNYSLATLPAEVSVGATMDYDMVNRAVQEIEEGKKLNKRITDRINNVGIYDPSIPTPQAPTISTPLFIDGKAADVKVADLPEEGGVTLKISARPTDFGAVQYNWRKYAYDSISGEYATTSDPLSEGIDNSVYEEINTIGDDVYYKINSVEGEPLSYMPIDKENELAKENNEYVYSENGFLTTNGNYIKLYKKYSTATVDSVGIYTVDIGARYGVNTVATSMEKADGITIPGPLKPTIEIPEEATEDGIIHIIAQNGAVTLSTSAHKSEADENAVVKLTYNWKKLNNGIEENLNGESIEESPVKLYSLGSVGHGHAPEDENEEDCIHNQAQITIVQKGTNVIVYHTGEELHAYTSTDPGQAAQGDKQWIGFDIDTGKDDIEGVIWGTNYSMSEVDKRDADSVGLGAGHIVFWDTAENLSVSGGRTIIVDGVELTVIYVEDIPSTETYTFNEDKNELIIEGLATSGLNEYYIAEVTAERNKVKTSENSGLYRVTNAPEKPIIKRFFNNQWNESDYLDEQNLIPFNMKRNGQYRTLTFSIEQPQQSDNLSYIWMRINKEDAIETDFENGETKLQIDLQDEVTNFLTDLFEDKPGSADIPVDGVYGLTTLTNLGEIIDSDENGNGPSLTFNANNCQPGVYYCIVVNELNNHRIANVTPFYNVTDN